MIETDRADHSRAKLDHDLIVPITRINPKSRDELVQLHFQAGWDGLMARYKRMITEEIFNKSLNPTASYFSNIL